MVGAWGEGGLDLYPPQTEHRFHNIHFTLKPAQHPGPGSLELRMVFCKLGRGCLRGAGSKSPGVFVVSGLESRQADPHVAKAKSDGSTFQGLRTERQSGSWSSDSEWDLSDCLPH